MAFTKGRIKGVAVSIIASILQNRVLDLVS